MKAEFVVIDSGDVAIVDLIRAYQSLRDLAGHKNGDLISAHMRKSADAIIKSLENAEYREVQA